MKHYFFNTKFSEKEIDSCVRDSGEVHDEWFGNYHIQKHKTLLTKILDTIYVEKV